MLHLSVRSRSFCTSQKTWENEVLLAMQKFRFRLVISMFLHNRFSHFKVQYKAQLSCTIAVPLNRSTTLQADVNSRRYRLPLSLYREPAGRGQSGCDVKHFFGPYGKIGYCGYYASCSGYQLESCDNRVIIKSMKRKTWL